MLNLMSLVIVCLKGVGIVNFPGSLQDKLNIKKGLPGITEVPDASNIIKIRGN